VEPYAKGTKLIDVPPEFRGMPLKEYLAECLMFERERSRQYFEKLPEDHWSKRWLKKRIQQPVSPGAYGTASSPTTR